MAIPLPSHRATDDHDEKREQLIRAAERLFSEQGFHATQVSDITKAAGTGIGTFYRNFADKDEILKALLERLFVQIHDRFVVARKGIESRTPLEQFAMIRENFRIILGELTERPNLALTFFRTGYGVNPAINELIWSFQERFADDLVDDMRRGEAAGLFRVPQARVLAHSFVGMVMQTAHALVIEKSASLEQAIDALTRFTLGGLLAFAPDERLMSIYRLLLHPPPVETAG